MWEDEANTLLRAIQEGRVLPLLLDWGLYYEEKRQRWLAAMSQVKVNLTQDHQWPWHSPSQILKAPKWTVFKGRKRKNLVSWKNKMSTEYFCLSAEEACFNNILEIPGDLVFLPSHLEHGTSLKVRQWFSVRHSSWETGFFSPTHSVLGFFLLWLNKNSLNKCRGDRRSFFAFLIASPTHKRNFCILWFLNMVLVHFWVY